MKDRVIIATLVAVNAVLIGLLLAARPNFTPTPATDLAPGTESVDRPVTVSPSEPPASAPAAATPFTKVYSPDPRRFAANLRSVGCPEQTIKDILTAEIHQRSHEAEEALRPKPADHVPYMWSANTLEIRLIERREKAALLAKEESAQLSEALGYQANVQLPQYAMRNSDMKFASTLADLPPEKQATCLNAHEAYWAGVRSLQDRTKGFWLPEDVAELNQLKRTRLEALQAIRSGQYPR